MKSSVDDLVKVVQCKVQLLSDGYTISTAITELAALVAEEARRAKTSIIKEAEELDRPKVNEYA